MGKIEDLNFYSSIKKDFALYVDITENIKWDSATILSDTEDGIIAKMKEWNGYFMGANNLAEAKRLLDMVPKTGEAELVVRGHGITEEIKGLAMNGGYGFDIAGQCCFQVMYERETPPECRHTLEVRHPDIDDFPKVASTYSLLSEEDLKAHFLGPDFIGGYLDGKLVGYAGLHSEGSMGMLYVFEEYRRRGFAEEISAALIKHQLDAGKVPFAQIYCDNTASLTMQKKMGYTFSKDYISWIIRN